MIESATIETVRRPIEKAARVPCDHIVQFYEGDSFLIRSVADFIIEGIRAEESVIVIATRAHLSSISDSLEQDGFSKETLKGSYNPFDAQETLSLFMANDLPDETLF